MDLTGTLQKYWRVLQIARKPTKEEFISSGKICSLGMALIGAIGFVIFLAFAFSGI